jgi:glycosyltransferase involved in cell wall biosynthesis
MEFGRGSGGLIRARGPSALVPADAWPEHRPSGWLADALAAAGAAVATSGRIARPRLDVGFVPADAPDETVAAVGRLVRRLVAVVDAPTERPPGAVHAVVATSAALRDTLSPELRAGVPVVLPAGLMEVVAPGRPDVARLVCTAPLHWTAGHEYALIALARARLAGARLALAVRGSGPASEAVRFGIEDLELGPAVSLQPGSCGPVAADLLLVSAVQDRAWADPVGALRAGLPIVGFDLPGLRELVGESDEACGMLVPARDAAALGDALVQLAHDPDLRRQLSERARRAGRALAPPAACGLDLLRFGG